jgi:1,4-dihydroxy-2-naphthoate octaprenyltransferase
MRHPVPEQKPADFPAEIWPLWYAPFAFDHTRKFGAVFLLGLLLDILLA